jgi:hypothetical protein
MAGVLIVEDIVVALPDGAPADSNRLFGAASRALAIRLALGSDSSIRLAPATTSLRMDRLATAQSRLPDSRHEPSSALRQPAAGRRHCAR